MYKKSSFVLLTVWCLLIVLIFRIFYVSFGKISDKVNTTAGGRFAGGVLYNSKGIIYDRNLIPLSGNQFVNYLIIDPRSFDLTKTEYIAEVTDTEITDLNNKLKRETPIILKCFTDVIDISGVTVFEGTGRYAQNRVAEHVVGYLDSECVVGMSGVEKAYDSFLSSFACSTKYRYYANAVRGIGGQNQIEFFSEADNLNGIVLSLDKRLCEVSKDAASKYIDKGCVIVNDCKTGEILSLVSLPTYEVDKIAAYSEKNNGELVNNALVRQSVGSVFKAVMAVSAFQNGLDKFEYNCSGSIIINGHTFMCQRGVEHGKQSIADAFANSCNCYFISLGQLLGYEKIIETAKLLGLDSSVKLSKDMYAESAILPNDNGELALANLSIGQGELMISPISISRLFSSLCNNGSLINPSLYMGTYIDGELSNNREYIYKNKVIDDECVEEMKKMCIECVQRGTGRNAMPENGGAGGKTASAQTGVFDENGIEKLNTYFVGFYPAENPQYVITVFAAGGKSGSATCAPVFKEICDFISINY